MTGGGSGTSMAIARRLGSEGAAVLVADLSDAAAEAVGAELRQQGARVQPVA